MCDCLTLKFCCQRIFSIENEVFKKTLIILSDGFLGLSCCSCRLFRLLSVMHVYGVNLSGHIFHRSIHHVLQIKIEYSSGSYTFLLEQFDVFLTIMAVFILGAILYGIGFSLHWLGNMFWMLYE